MERIRKRIKKINIGSPSGRGNSFHGCGTPDWSPERLCKFLLLRLHAQSVKHYRYTKSDTRQVGLLPRKKWVTQGGTQTNNLANGLPCSNQLSYTESPSNSVAEFVYLRMSCQGSRRRVWWVWSVRHRLGKVPWVPILSIISCTVTSTWNNIHY